MRFEVDAAFIDTLAAQVARKLRHERARLVEPPADWASLAALGRQFGCSRVTAWRVIRAANGSATADDGPIRRRAFSKRRVVFSTADFDRELARITRERRNRAA